MAQEKEGSQLHIRMDPVRLATLKRMSKAKRYSTTSEYVRRELLEPALDEFEAAERAAGRDPATGVPLSEAM